MCRDGRRGFPLRGITRRGHTRKTLDAQGVPAVGNSQWYDVVDGYSAHAFSTFWGSFVHEGSVVENLLSEKREVQEEKCRPVPNTSAGNPSEAFLDSRLGGGTRIRSVIRTPLLQITFLPEG
jgi:hypothetical protein